MAFSSPVTDLAQQVHSAVQSGRQDRAETDESVPWRQPMPHSRATKPSKVSATWPEGVKISGKSASASVTGNKRTVVKSAATLAVSKRAGLTPAAKRAGQPKQHHPKRHRHEKHSDYRRRRTAAPQRPERTTGCGRHLHRSAHRDCRCHRRLPEKRL